VLAALLVTWILGTGCASLSGKSGVQAAEPVAPVTQPGMTEAQFLDKIDELMAGMGAPKIEDRKDAQMSFERICFDNSAPSRKNERAALCKAIMQRVGSNVAKPARVWLLRKVESIGREEVVDGLTALLADSDPEIRELARRALENNPTSQAGAVLRSELGKTTDNAWRVAIINALAFRNDKQATPAICKLTGDEDKAVAAAAISALGTIADDASLDTLASLRKNAPCELRCKANDASLRAAQKLVAAGSKKKAAPICEEIFANAPVEGVRIAALEGLTAAKGADALPTLIDQICGKDERMQLVAARCAQRIPGGGVTASLTGALKKASPDAQAVLLEMLGKRGDGKAAAAVMTYVNAAEPEVRTAAIGALRYIGNGSNVEMLASFAAKSKDAERDAARDSLKWMRGKDVDAAILKLTATADDRVKAELVRAAAVRLMRPAFDLLLATTNDADESVRVPVVYNLGKLAKPADLPRVIASFQKLEGEKTLATAKDSLVQICSKIDDESQRAKPLIDTMASSTPGAQVILIQALASLQGQPALNAIRKCAASDNAQVKQAAAKALAEWGPSYCTQWVAAGAFNKEGVDATKLFDTAFPPEDPQASVEWKPVKEQKGRDFDLKKVVKGDTDCCVYLRTQVISEAAQDVVLTLGSDDGIKVWLNGAVVHANNAARGFKLDEDQVKVTLKQGANTLLIKVTQGAGQWQFACGVKSPQGGPADGVKFEAK
jgi:HEAT repeat protein